MLKCQQQISRQKFGVWIKEVGSRAELRGMLVCAIVQSCNIVRAHTKVCSHGLFVLYMVRARTIELYKPCLHVVLVRLG